VGKRVWHQVHLEGVTKQSAASALNEKHGGIVSLLRMHEQKRIKKTAIVPHQLDQQN